MNSKEKAVADLGAAAYLLMLGYKPIGKREKSIIFEVYEDEESEFEEKKIEYLRSDFHRFDSCLMSLKKLSEYGVNRFGN